MLRVQEAVVEQQMRESGMTQGRLVMLFIYAVTVLLMVFAFIFIGVNAFLGAGTFGAIVNSILTAGAFMHLPQTAGGTGFCIPPRNTYPAADGLPT